MAREDAVARELGQPPDQDLVERVGRGAETSASSALDQARAQTWDPVSTVLSLRPRAASQSLIERSAPCRRPSRAAAACGDQASALTAAPWPWSSWAPAPSFDADQTRTALSLPPVRISISESGAASFLGENTHRHAIEQASRRWREKRQEI